MDACRFTGKVAFITGAARGQGRAEAVRLAEEGADIIAVDACIDFASTAYDGATDSDLKETVRLVEALGRRIIATKTDVRDFAGLSAALDAGIAELGRLDVVVANAGICSANMSWEITPEQWHRARQNDGFGLGAVQHSGQHHSSARSRHRNDRRRHASPHRCQRRHTRADLHADAARPGQPAEDIAAAVAFLGSDEAHHITGIAMPLDLGTLIR